MPYCSSLKVANDNNDHHISSSKRTFFQKPIPKLVLLDRDGVVNKDVGSPGVIRKDQLELTHMAGYAIGRLKREKNCCRVVLVTNQSCVVGKGLISKSDLDHIIHKELQKQLLQQDSDAKLDNIYVCTTTSRNDDPRRKPNPGMVLEACRDASCCASIHPSSTDVIMIGDSSRDLEAATNAGVSRRFLVSTGYGASLMGGKIPTTPTVVNTLDDDESLLNHVVLPFVYCKDLNQVVEWILE